MLKAVCVVLCRDERNSDRAKKEVCDQRKEQGAVPVAEGFLYG